MPAHKQKLFQDKATQSQGNPYAKRVICETDLLLYLFTVCKVPLCGSLIDRDNVKVYQKGAAITVNTTCNNSHQSSWSSSKKVGEGRKKSNVINIEMAAYTLFSGLNITQVQRFKPFL